MRMQKIFSQNAQFWKKECKNNCAEIVNLSRRKVTLEEDLILAVNDILEVRRWRNFLCPTFKDLQKHKSVKQGSEEKFLLWSPPDASPKMEAICEDWCPCQSQFLLETKNAQQMCCPKWSPQKGDDGILTFWEKYLHSVWKSLKISHVYFHDKNTMNLKKKMSQFGNIKGFLKKAEGYFFMSFKSRENLSYICQKSCKCK